jgi:hypothetical protein
MSTQEEGDLQQVDYDESALQAHQDDYQNSEFQQAEQQRTSSANDDTTKPKTLMPDANGDIINPNVLFISRFRFGTTTEADIKKHFDKYGPIKSVVLRHKVAYVEYENEEDAKRAKHDAHHQPGLGSDSVIVDFKKENKVKVFSFNLCFQFGDLF